MMQHMMHLYFLSWSESQTSSEYFSWRTSTIWVLVWIRGVQVPETIKGCLQGLLAYGGKFLGDAGEFLHVVMHDPFQMGTSPSRLQVPGDHEMRGMSASDGDWFLCNIDINALFNFCLGYINVYADFSFSFK